MSELEVTEDQVREEHLADVDQGRQWAYLLSVLGGGMALMLGLIALLDAT